MRRRLLIGILAAALFALGSVMGPGWAAATTGPPQAGPYKGKSNQGFPVYFRVTDSGEVTNIRLGYRESICGKQNVHDPTAALGIDEAGRFKGAIYSGRVEFEGTFVTESVVKGRLIALEQTGLPGCLRKVVGFTASPR